jgi:hypothetical protein
MRWRLMPLLLSSSLIYATAAWEATVSQNLQVPVAQSQAISSVTLSNNSFQGGAPSGTVIGAIAVTMSPLSPSFTGTLSLSGANASSFQVAGGNLVTSGVLPAGTYQVNVVATESGMTNSPFVQAATITATSSGCPFTSSLSDGCSGAQAHGTIVDARLADPHAVTDLSIVGGSGYTNGTYTWTSSGGGCSVGATGTITVLGGQLGGAARGTAGNYSITNEGSGCTSRPTIAVPAGAGPGTGGTITATVYQLTPHNASPSWNVAGVDYPIGYDTTLSLKDPTTASLPSGCTFSGSTVTCAGSGGMLNGYDFSLHSTKLAVTASGWTVSNNKFVCTASSAGALATVSSAVTSVTFKYNTFNGGASLGHGCTSGGLVASINSSQNSGSITIEYNYCFNPDSKCVNFQGSTANGSLTITEQYNYWAEIGLCGGGCAHGESEYAYVNNNTQTFNWTLAFNTAITHYWSGPTNATSEFAQEADNDIVVTNTNHNFGIARGNQAYTGSNNNSGQVSSAALYCGHQNDPSAASESGSSTNNIWDYSGAFFPYNTTDGTCTKDLSSIADFNAGTGHACSPSSCN